jgi:hypothetical protein
MKICDCKMPVFDAKYSENSFGEAYCIKCGGAPNPQIHAENPLGPRRSAVLDVKSTDFKIPPLKKQLVKLFDDQDTMGVQSVSVCEKDQWINVIHDGTEWSMSIINWMKIVTMVDKHLPQQKGGF